MRCMHSLCMCMHANVYICDGIFSNDSRLFFIYFFAFIAKKARPVILLSPKMLGIPYNTEQWEVFGLRKDYHQAVKEQIKRRSGNISVKTSIS